MKKEGTMRADAWLKSHYPGLSKRQVEEALTGKLVTLPNGKSIKKGDTVGSSGLNCSRLQAHLKQIRKGNSNLHLKILYEGDGWCCIDKPAGIACNPLGIFELETVSHWALKHFSDQIEGFEEIQPKLCPHRLDTGTSGALIVCFKKDVYESFRKYFQKREVKKTYLAWCWGTPEKKAWSVRFPIAKASGDSKRRVALISDLVKHRPPILEAHTEVKVLRQKENYFLAEIEMKTGVTHQVRVHMSASGYPLVGDKLYDLKTTERTNKPPFHLLRAVRIEVAGVSVAAPSGIFESGV